MNIPQIIVIVMFSLNVGISLAKHGQSQGRYSFWATLISVAIWVGLLTWGGFF